MTATFQSLSSRAPRPAGAGSRLPTRERGVSLLIAMVMLVIIGLTSVAVMRNTMSSDVVSINSRAQAQANQYAMVAEKFCEAQINKSGFPAPLAQNLVTPNWTVFKNWFPAPGAAQTLKTADLNLDTTIAQPSVMPQCMLELTTVGTGATMTSAFIVTARGFSLDYRADSKGNTASGSVAWLQAVVSTN